MSARPADWLAEADRDSPWHELSVCVGGIRVVGIAVAEVLLRHGAQVHVVDERATPVEEARADALRVLGAKISLGTDQLPPDVDLVVVSPGYRPTHPIAVSAADRGVPVWGDAELAWRLRNPETRWLAVTGTNGKTTTVRMLAAMLEAAGQNTAAVGNIGEPLVVAVERDYDVLAVELSTFQLHWSASVAAFSAALLNITPDHLDWHGSFEAYAEAKALIWRGTEVAVGNAADPDVVRRLAAAPGRHVTFTGGKPAPGQLGVIDDVLVDTAFADGAELANVAEVRPTGPHNVQNALAAAALARSIGVPAAAVRAGLLAYEPDRHRNEFITEIAGVRYVDDSKATNPGAAAASLSTYESVVWIAGGLLKGASVDELVQAHAHRLRGVVLLGTERGAIRDAVARHAPEVRVIEVASTDTGAMAEAVAAARALARVGDVVLLAPAAASMDMFSDYKQRGDVFAAAVRDLRDKA